MNKHSKCIEYEEPQSITKKVIKQDQEIAGRYTALIAYVKNQENEDE